jgi:hypothetical protein
MLPLPMGRIVVAMDGAIQMLPVPMMCKATYLHLRPPEIDVASVDEKYPQFGINVASIYNNIGKFFSGHVC